MNSCEIMSTCNGYVSRFLFETDLFITSHT